MTAFRETTTVPTLDRERLLFKAGYPLVAGMDEVGRGALAGPVSVGVVLLGGAPGPMPEGLRDSKLLSPVRRAALVDVIGGWATANAVGHASAEEVDQVGLTAALRLAGRRALEGLAVAPQVVILDGAHDWLSEPDDPSSIPTVHTLVKADRLCASVAAASIVAKVTRDRLLQELAVRYPVYGFDRNKGYGSPTHMAALREYGPCPEHRRSWSLPPGPPSQ